MYFRFSQQYIAALNLFLIGIIAYFLALAVSNGIKLHLAKLEVSGFSESSGPKQLRRSQGGPRTRAYYNTIVQRDIFSRAPVASIQAPVQNENLDITLVGTSHLSAGKPFIIIETSDGDQSLYRQGETIPNVGRVLSISREKAEVLHNGHRVVLQIPNVGEGETTEPVPMPFGLRRRFMRPPRFRPGMPPAPVGPYGAMSEDGSPPVESQSMPD